MTERPASVVSLLRDGGRPLAALLLVALLVKVVVAAAALGNDPLATQLISDSRYYVERAAGIAGRPDPLADEPHHLPPLYPWLLALVPGAIDGEVAGVLVLQALLGTALLAGVWLLARRRASRAAALAAVALTLGYGPLTFFETKVLGDSLTAALMIAWLVAADRLADGQRARALGGDAGRSASRSASIGALWRPALLGALAGATALARPQALLLVVVGAAWAGRVRRAAGVVALLAGLAVLAPSAAHNLRASGELIFVSDNAGVNLWLASTGPVSGTFDTHRPEFGDIHGQAAAARRVAEQIAGRPLSFGGVSRTLALAGVRAALADPAVFAQRLLWRALALVESFETGVIGFFAVERRLVAPLWLLPLPFGVLLGGWVAARVLAAGARRSAPTAGNPASAPGTAVGPAPVVPMLAVAGTIALTALLFFHYSRFRLPLVPVLAVDLAASVHALRGRPRPGLRRQLVAAGLGLATVAISHLPAPHHDEVVANGWTTLGEARLIGIAPGDVGAVERALADAERALAARSGFARAELLAARALFLLGRFEAAHARLAHIEAHMPGFPPLLLLQARLHSVPHPENGYHDPERARQILRELREAARGDPAMQSAADDIEHLLAATAGPEARGGEPDAAAAPDPAPGPAPGDGAPR